MADFNDEHLALGRIYADSMLALATESNQAAALRDELADLSAYIERNPDFANFMASPTVDDDIRKASIEKLFRGKFSDVLVDSLQVLNSKGRAGLVQAVAEAYRLALEESQGRVEVFVKSATVLTPELRARIVDMVQRRSGRTPQLVESVDESLIAGVVIQIGDEKLDGSVSRQLKILGEKLLERASQEIHSGRSLLAEAH